MMTSYELQAGRLAARPGLPGAGVTPVWIDLFALSAAEEADVERLVGIDVPTRDEMQKIEISSRLYSEDGALFMTALLPALSDSGAPDMQPVSFVLAGPTLLTVRYHAPRAFETFSARAAKVPLGCDSSETVLLALLEAIVERLADILERIGRDVDGISRAVFGTAPETDGGVSLKTTLKAIGRAGDLTSQVRDSLMSLERLNSFFGQQALQRKDQNSARERIKTLEYDIRSLSDHAGFLAQKVTFLLDATLGLINIEQNAIIKIFSVVAVAFLPPTLIASIYGMNFEHMPELAWPFGYPFAIGLMIASAILPWLYFKRRGWL
ncbi:magnesium transporter [Ruegeria intermedia]|uniref:Magnesium transport protein CorA n=1 Tax=Ruegeria intermedia TaxID=996115 RepID=A0A1M5BWL8_9RHOB|nr:magnesium transporter CorA family protein [Ruegeria intermedia]SHF46924.1 magnesium transporter [Ruegeria intermedia]